MASALDFCNTFPCRVRFVAPRSPALSITSRPFIPSFLKGWHCDLPFEPIVWDFCFAVVGPSPPLLPLSQVSFCRADASQVGASPLGSRLSPIKHLPWNPIQQFLLCINRRVPSFSLLGFCWVRFCVPRPLRWALHVVLPLCSQMYALRPPIRARIRVIPAGQFQCLCFDPFSLPASGQHLSCRREPGRGLTSGFEAPPFSRSVHTSTGGFSLDR